MKKLAIFTLIAMLLVSLTVPFSSAAVDIKTVMKATPVVDGKVDDLYLVSAQAALEEKNFWKWGDIDDTDTDATVYYLYDDTNLYYVIDAYDSTVLASKGADWKGDTWMMDGAEMRFKVGEVYFKVITGATEGHPVDGYIITDGKDEEGDKIDISNMKVATTIKADGYVIEVALPLASIGLKAEAGQEVAATLQINDVVAADGSTGSAFGGFRVFEARKGIQNHTYKFSADAPNPPLALKHTPVLDGQIDEAYLKSASQTLKNLNFWGWAGDPSTYAAATAYVLWDDNYFYIAIDATDLTLITTNDGSAVGGDDTNPWRNDSAELWFNDEGLIYKIHGSVGGAFFVGTDEDGMASFDFSKAILKSAAKPNNDGFTLEFALPLNNLAAGRVVTMEMQINDTYDDARTAGWASGGKGSYDALEKIFICSDTLAEPAPVTDAPAPVTDAPSQGGDTPAVQPPVTLDAGVIVAAVALVSLAGIVVAKKKH